MREIKFRAWDKEDKEWIINDVFISIPNGKDKLPLNRLPMKNFR